MDHQENDSDPSSETENSWILFTVVGASVLIVLIAIIALYDLYSRCREYNRNQQICDGGPPASPDHQYSYKIEIRVEEASPSFDTKQSVIKMDLLDHQNQYITSLAIPSFVFKFKADQTGSQPLLQLNQAPPCSSDALAYKSMSAFYDTWSKKPKSNPLTFNLIRRNPLHNLASIRLTHDCYNANAHITFQYIIIDGVKIDLQNKPIQAIHPCPPSGLQVFHAVFPETNNIANRTQTLIK